MTARSSPAAASAILANGKRCPNAAVPGSRFCGIPAHRELAEREAAGEELEASQVVGGVSDEPEEVEEAPAEDAAGRGCSGRCRGRGRGAAPRRTRSLSPMCSR